MFLKAVSFIARLGALAGSIIVLGLVASFIHDLGHAEDFLIFIEVCSAITLVGALIPPYPHFVYDGFFGVMWAICAGFMLLELFVQTDCYGFSKVTGRCPSYTAATTFCFLTSFAWLGSAFFGAVRVLLDIFAVANKRIRGVGINPTEAKTESYDDTVDIKAKGILAKSIVRHWFLYSVAGIIALAIAIPILIFYALPPFAQYMVDQMEVPITGVNASMTNPTNDSIHFDLWSTVRVPGAVYPSLSGMNASFYVGDRVSQPDAPPFAMVNIPALKFSPGDHLELRNQTLTLGDVREFARFVNIVAYNKTFTIRGTASTTVKVAGLSAKVNIDKVAGFPGFHNFTDFLINSVALTRPDEAGNNIEVELLAPNPAPATIDLGNITGEAVVGNIVVGNATINALTLQPGNHTYAIEGQAFLDVANQHIEELLRIEYPYLRQGLVVAGVRGKNVVYNGQHLPYWEKAFQTIDLTATRDAKTILKQALEGSLGSLLGNSSQLSGLSGLMGSNLVGSGLDLVIDAGLKLIASFPDDPKPFLNLAVPLCKTVLSLLPTLGF
ncbi:hypothetical protein P152DRAFT_417634 [Eremomyces bilateralis CBS 781.70]|uniref:Uncharacterized protein n=1 Tax=Eremomyces bilateralis CBS 781.70 TaxID=1392243 RepID=A0A6G1G2Z0_9PEZI|nr:uncharacterized protein P152DRAFT_417634 [Eremomyces bilateralis CBS 781.70]KAF1812424.1 hypothetical protein P152DRAFT_417634 [Eremomyces bilateralis CBS 781.70]